MAKVEVIERMDDDSFDNICEAGVELYAELRRIMTKFGVPVSASPSVLAVATGAMLCQANGAVDVDGFVNASAISSQFFRQDDVDGEPLFDPPHKRPGFVPVVREIGN